ncbi:uncharacterized protein V1513DRAFT_452136 [Lipomyces chichibuensis]|uniref:uncharacterized protein n=1 Tax=Lipomyces chichibuensis TaxID=1546026 RepID=UPI0033439E00
MYGEDEDAPLLDQYGGPISSPSGSAAGSRPPTANFTSTAVQSGSEPRRTSFADRRPPTVIPPSLGPPKQGPQRTSKIVQKLKLLPEDPAPHADQAHSERPLFQGPDDFYRDPERLGKVDRRTLPRVTAYCTASSYRLKEFARYLQNRNANKAVPKIFDECLYSVYSYRHDEPLPAVAKSPDDGDSSSDESPTDGLQRKPEEQDLVRLDSEGAEIRIGIAQFSEIFVFEYGVVVLWGFTVQEEQRFLREIPRFELEKLAPQDVQIEEFNYYITKSYQPRIYNDFIALRDASNYMTKLSISHAIAQSVKISLFEELVDHTIKTTQDIPIGIARTGKVQMSRKKIMMQIGDLFILRININLHGSIIDSPELMWSEPQLEPLYQATKSYLEINQRVSVLNQRLEVISDLLQMLKEQLGHTHEEYLEFVVIILIAAEIMVAMINIAVDMVAEAR